MTKEELEKEIKNYIDESCNQWETDGLTVDDIVRIAVLDFAEPREKRIEELTEQNTSLLTSVENLNKSVQELEAQIEKMKCCENCKNRKWDKENKEFICGYVCKNREYWELRR